MRGKVSKLKDGFGFIRDENGAEYYFKVTDLVKIDNNLKLQIGSNVEFEIRKTHMDGKKDSAFDIKILEDELVKYFKENILNLRKINYDEFCDKTKEYAGRLMSGKVNTSMLRKVYSRVLNAKSVESIKRLRPQFAYLVGRNEKNHTLKEFMDILDYLAREMKNEEHLACFKDFFEAIIAYRKYAGNDDK